MNHSFNPIMDIFKTLRKYDITPSRAAGIFQLSEATQENWFYGRTTPNPTNYKRLRFLCCLVENPVLVILAANQLYHNKEENEGRVINSARHLNKQRLAASLEIAKTLMYMNQLAWHSEGNALITRPVRTFIHENIKKLLDHIYTMYRIDHSYSGAQSYSLQIISLIDRKGVIIPDGFEEKLGAKISMTG